MTQRQGARHVQGLYVLQVVGISMLLLLTIGLVILLVLDPARTGPIIGLIVCAPVWLLYWFGAKALKRRREWESS